MRLVERPGPLLSEHTTIRLGGRARLELVASAPEALEDLPQALERHGLPFFILGRGSNLLVRDGDLDLVVIRLESAGAPEVLAVEEKSALVRASAGMGLPGLVGFLVRSGFAGLEGLAGIPGSVGGAVAMNAGSFGQSIGGCLSRVRRFTEAGGLQWLKPADFAIGYRSFRIAGNAPWFVVAEAEFTLARQRPEALADKMREIYRLKKASQPLFAHSAGCAFKNPAPDAPAGRLMEEAGLKGYRLGDMAFSEQHANFLVNLGGGTSGQALELIELARERVRENSGREMELEVKVTP